MLTVLQQAYESGRVDVNEMRERQDKTLRAVFIDELSPLVVDLPEGHAIVSQGIQPIAPAPNTQVDTGPPDAGFSLSVMSGRSVKVPRGTRELRNFAWWGGNDFDLTDAMGPGRIVTLKLTAVMGGSDILVPPGVRVVDRSLAIMAGNEIQVSAQGDGSNGTLVIEGFLMWAGNDVKLADGWRQG